MNKERFINFFKDVFSINENKATKQEIKEEIVSASKLKGTNMSILIFAIIISCIGLNLNSESMVIGAMLISPMMGSIMGVAYALAIGDAKFFRRAFAALVIQITVSLITSTAYFLITPISAPSVQLLSFTKPSVWMVIIAIVGGLSAGIGLTRKEKGNILSGVAIATGLIPPLCTVGYSIATLNWKYLINALYFFVINAYFICVSAIIVFKIIRISRKKEEKMIKNNLIIISIILIIPSIFLAYPIVKENTIKESLQSYLDNEFTYENTQVVKSDIDVKTNEIKLVLAGNVLEDDDIVYLSNKLKDYELYNMRLKIIQTNLPTGIQDEKVSKIVQEDVINENKGNNNNFKEITDEVKLKFDKIKECTITNNKIIKSNEENVDNIIITIQLKENINSDEYDKIKELLKERLGENITVNITF